MKQMCTILTLKWTRCFIYYISSALPLASNKVMPWQNDKLSTLLITVGIKGNSDSMTYF